MSQKDWPGSVLSKTPVTPSGPYQTSTASGIWSMNDVAYWVKQAYWPTQGSIAPDPYFYDVSLLLTGDGTNGAQNNTFLDSSSNAFTLTRNGNTTQGTFSPYGSLWSNYFASSYLSFADNAAFNFGTGDFTIEMWAFCPVTQGAYAGLITFTTDGGNGLGIGFGNGDNKLRIIWSNTQTILASSAMGISTWTHVALVRSGATVTLYQNGSSVGTYNIGSSAMPYINVGGAIGRLTTNTNGYYFNGYISNLRVVKGTAVYTSAFTPSTTPLTAVSGTSLLTCQSNRFIDNSSNNFTLTVNGSPSVQRFSPFNPAAAYDAATISGSGYFDGGGDAVGATGSISLGTGDFTAEAWWYPMVGPLQEACFIAVGDASQSSGFCLVTDNSRGLFVYSAGYVTAGYGFTPKLYAWNHVAVTRSGGTLRTYLNGSVCESASYGNNVSGAAYVGRTANGYFTNTNGYIAGARVLNTALYTGSTYTIPTSPFTNNANTQFLCNFTNAGIPDAAMANDIGTVGNAQVSTSVVKYGTGSLLFNGTTDYLYLSNSYSVTFGTGDFTIECWANATYSDPNPIRALIWTGDYSYACPFLYSQTGYWRCRIANTQVTGSSVVTNAWQHIAMVRYNGVLKLYVDGVGSAGVADTQNCFTQGAWIGGGYYFGPAWLYTGYIDDFRITKGYARYTANFTPPTAAFQTF